MQIHWNGPYLGTGWTEGVAVVGTTAYVAQGDAGLEILDVRDPVNPVRLGGYDTSGTACAVAVSGSLAYVADGTAGVLILDVSNPANPLRLGEIRAGHSAVDVLVCGDLAYVADGEAGLAIVDVSRVDPPPAPDLLAASDTGISSTDNITRDTTPTFGFSLPAGSYWRVYRDGVQVSGDCETGASYTAPPQANGTYGYSLATVDAAGNASPLSPALSVTIDASIPFAPDLVPVSDTGLSDTDNLTRLDNSQPEKTLQFAVANTIAGATVTLYADGTAVGSAVADGATTTITTNGSVDLTDGTHTITARQTLPGGSESTDSEALRVTIDTNVPASPQGLDLQAASDTGISNADNITGDNTPTFKFSVPVGPYFRFYRDGVQISGDYETGASYTAAVQVDGTYGYTVAAADSAGNVSVPSVALSVTVDVSIPSAPDLLAVSDTGLSNTDNRTNLDNSLPEKTLQFTVGNTIAGATVTLYADGVAIGGATADGTTTTLATNGSVDLTDWPHVITARQTVPGQPESTDSAALKVTIDTSAPIVTPFRLGGYDTSGSAYGVTVVGTLAYVADGGAGLQIIEVSNPAAPVRLGALDTTGFAYGVAIVGTLAYVADGNAGLQIIDVSNPAAPVRLGGYDTSGMAWHVAVSGTLAYVADGGAGLQIIEVSNPAAPVQLGGYDISEMAWDVVVSGTLAYVAGDSAGLVIIDVSNPTAPVQLGGCDTIGTANGVAVVGTLAYVADGSAGLVIIDVSNPAAPVQLRECDTIGTANGVAIVGTLAYVADGKNGGLQIFDIGNPAMPVWRGGANIGGTARGLAVWGALAYVADYDVGLVIIDVSLAEAPPAPDLQDASDTGISPTDNITADNTPTFSFSTPAVEYFRLYRDGVQISADYAIGLSYTAALQTDGAYGYTIALVDTAGNVSEQSPSLAVTIDTKPPTVANVLVGSTRWTGEFLAELNAASGQNVGGCSISVGTGAQLSPVAWGNIDQIKIVFNEGVMVDKDDLTLSGVNTPTYDLAGATFAYDPATFTATWTLASVIPADKLEIRLNADGADSVQDPIARRLDGEWTNPASPTDTGTDTYPSGNGTAGGNFVFRFRTLPCDANQDGSVDIFDVASVQASYGQDHGMMPDQGDFDGNGTVDIFDVALLQVAYGSTLAPPAPMPAAAPSAEAVGQAVRQPLLSAMPSAADEVAEAIALARVSSPTNGTALRVRLAAADVPASCARVDRRHIRRNGAHAAARPMPPLAVRHAIENAAWETAVDRLLESDELEWTR
ncbi:MAG: Ig-like domain-containing protein [Pirellulales bacterium]